MTVTDARCAVSTVMSCPRSCLSPTECLSDRSVWSADFQLIGEQEIVQFSEKYFADTEPVIAIYLLCLRTLRAQGLAILLMSPEFQRR